MSPVRLIPICAAALAAAAAPAMAQDDVLPPAEDELELVQEPDIAPPEEEEDSPFPNPFEDDGQEASPFAPGADSPFTAGDDELQDPEDDFRAVTEGDRVVLRALNKVTAATRDFVAYFDDPLQFGSLTVVPRYCSRRPPELIPETFVFLEIYDRTFDGAVTGEYGQRIFSGWMLGSSPALHGLEHPVYDVWPVACLTESEPDPTAEDETQEIAETEAAIRAAAEADTGELTAD